MRRFGRLTATAGLALMVMLFQAGGVFAEIEIKDLNTVLDKATIGGELNLFYRYDKDPYFGAPIGDTDKTDTGYAEIFGRVRFTVAKNVDWTTLEAQFAPFYAATIDQDGYGLAKDDDQFDIDQAWLKFQKVFDTPVDLTLGRQDISLEKWFVMGDGDTQEAANWLFFLRSFPFAVRADLDLAPFSATVFWARAGDYVANLEETVQLGPKDDVEVAGFNLHYDFAENNYLYGGIYRKIEDGGDVIFSEGGQEIVAENNTLAFDVGANFTFGGLLLEGEFVYQTGDAGKIGGDDRDRDAMGGFASATYTFPVPFSPFVRGSYMYFSGDDDLEDDTAEAYDPMFFDFIAWNRWIIGELVGEYQLPVSNKQVAIAEVGFTPIEPMVVTLMYLNHRLDEKNYLGTSVDSDEWADEINLLVDYPINDHLFVHAGLGYVMPNDAAEEVFGNDENAFFSHIWLSFNF